MPNQINIFILFLDNLPYMQDMGYVLYIPHIQVQRPYVTFVSRESLTTWNFSARVSF